MPELKLWGERQLSRLKRDMDRMFEALCTDFGLPPARPFGDSGMQWSETGDEVVIRVRAPGLSPENLDVSVSHRRVVIQGVRTERGENTVRTEAFRKEVYLPCPVAAGDVRAAYENGVVEIRIPKRVALRCGLPTQPR